MGETVRCSLSWGWFFRGNRGHLECHAPFSQMPLISSWILHFAMPTSLPALDTNLTNNGSCIQRFSCYQRDRKVFRFLAIFDDEQAQLDLGAVVGLPGIGCSVVVISIVHVPEVDLQWVLS